MTSKEAARERLTQRDLRALLQCLRGLYAQLDLEGFTTQIFTTLPKIIPSELTSYNEFNPRRRRAHAVVEPADALSFPDAMQIFEHHTFENPLIAYYHRTHDRRALKISDFLTQSQFHRLGLYNEFFRRLGVENLMATTFPAPPPQVVGISLTRGRRDFTERERLLLNLLSPHLGQAYHNANALTQMEQELARLSQVAEASDRGVILLTREGQVRWMTGRGRRQLADYFGRLPRSAHRLPEPLERWLQEQRALLAQEAGVPPPREPLVVEREGRRLVVRLVAGRPEEPPLLLLEEEPTAFSAASLESLGLGRREADVLFWVAQGKTNPEVALILGVSPRTVQTHLERVYQKLGVETRMAATLQALEDLKLLRR